MQITLQGGNQIRASSQNAALCNPIWAITVAHTLYKYLMNIGDVFMILCYKFFCGARQIFSPVSVYRG